MVERESTSDDERRRIADGSGWTGTSGRPNRRDFLKGAATAAVSAGALATPGSAQEYDEITAQGQVIRIDSGETWENKLIDFGYKNDITIVANGTDWTIRNVGFTGTMPAETIFNVGDTGWGTSRMENIYIGEGDVNQDSSDRGIAIWVDPDHSGRLEVTNVNFSVPGNNGIYGSAPGSNSGGNRGDIVIDGCYALDCHHTAYRVSDNDDVIRNSVSYVSGDRAVNRNCWIWESPDGGYATLENLDLVTNGVSTSVVERDDPTIEMTNVCTDDGLGTGCSPQNYVPDGCPASAEEAASGGSSGGGGSGEPPEYPVIEDFERDNPLADYGGEEHLFGTTSSAYEGSTALVNDGGDYGSLISTSGLDEYPSRGDEFEVHFSNASDDNFVGVHFFAQSETDNPNSYSVGIGNSGGWRMWHNEDGTIDEIAVTDLPASEQISGWYRAEISSDDTTIYADLYDDSTDELLASLEVDDTSYESGGIGFRSRGNGEVWDYAVFDESSTSVVEDFERTDPLAEYGGADSLFETTSSAYEGSQALVNDSGDYGSAVSTSGLDTYPERGDTFEVHFSNASDDNFVGVHFFAQSETDSPDGYVVGIGNSGGWRMWRNEDGTINEVAVADLPASEQISGWYRAEIITDDSTVYADLYDDAEDELLASLEVDDTTYDSGGIGFRSAGNGEVFDYVVIDE